MQTAKRTPTPTSPRSSLQAAGSVAISIIIITVEKTTSGCLCVIVNFAILHCVRVCVDDENRMLNSPNRMHLGAKQPTSHCAFTLRCHSALNSRPLTDTRVSHGSPVSAWGWGTYLWHDVGCIGCRCSLRHLPRADTSESPTCPHHHMAHPKTEADTHAPDSPPTNPNTTQKRSRRQQIPQHCCQPPMQPARLTLENRLGTSGT